MPPEELLDPLPDPPANLPNAGVAGGEESQLDAEVAEVAEDEER